MIEFLNSTYGKKAYEIVCEYIRDNIDEIQRHAVTTFHDLLKEEWIAGVEEFFSMGDAEENEEYWEFLDAWHSYGTNVDLHFVNEGIKSVRCFAYPVLNDCTNTKFEIEISMEGALV